MIFSIYNTCLHPNKKDTVIYNSFTGSFVFIKNMVITNRNEDVSLIKEKSPKLFENLVRAGVIVESDCDEVSKLKDRIKKFENNEHEYIIHINPTLDCNFHCWYCYENHIRDSKMNEDTLEGVKKYIYNILQNEDINNLNIGFFGGEPLLGFDCVREIVKYSDEICRENNVNLRLNFTSNGGLLTDEIISFLSNYECGFQITLDGGRYNHDHTRFSKDGSGSYDVIVNNIKKLAEQHVQVVIRVNYTAKNIGSVREILSDFINIEESLKSYLSFDFQRVWQERQSRFDETESEVNQIRDDFRRAAFFVSTNYIPQYVTNVCYGDKRNHVLINYNGDVFGCTARDFTVENRIGYLTNEGIIKFNQNKIELRETYKLSNESCKKCSIAPLCGGGCKQRAFEQHNRQGCPVGYTQADIEDIVCDIFNFYHKDNGQ